MDLDTLIAHMAATLWTRYYGDTDAETAARAVARARLVWKAVLEK